MSCCPGVVMISCALVCDAVIGNVQEKSMRAHGASNTEVVLYSYSIGFVYLLVTMVLTGALWPGLSYCSQSNNDEVSNDDDESNDQQMRSLASQQCPVHKCCVVHIALLKFSS
ncbi:hypothetical protein J6590_006632 [Homalodisca vitripennis]|nr:hypothetical protein J6590_006632 [Homalodisca vitripennis]